MNKIKTLDTHLTNMIAAGEVVERPSGIIKELVENSIDANSTQITIKILEGGMNSIEVIDNGEGISKEDIPHAFMRHSTSKISHPEDLNAIISFGFRGEALPSIASVSLVTLLSNTGDQGYKYIIDNGQEIEFTPHPLNKGTQIKVEELFLKTPARLKFIKNVRYEAALILDIVQKFAVSHPSISFSYYNEDKLTFRSFGTGNLEDVFHNIYGSFISEDFKEIVGEDYDFKISGLGAAARHNRSNRYSIWIYLNGRMIKYPRLQKAIVDAYRHHLPHDRYPIVILNIEVSPQLVDVNVHPSKWEIRLSKEKELITLIESTIEKKLFIQTNIHRVVLPNEENVQFSPKDLAPIRKEIVLEEPSIDYKVEAKQESTSTTQEDTSISVPKETSNSIYVEEQEVSKIIEEKREPQFEYLEVLSQFSGKYILASGTEGLYIIDQHAAMERIRYEYFTNKLLYKEQSIQPLLIPFTFEGRGKIVEEIDRLNTLTSIFPLTFEVLDVNTLILREIPMWIDDKEIIEFTNKVLDSFEEDKKLDEEIFRKKAIATLACHSSVRFNEYLSQQEMEKLVEDLRYCKQPFHCPHGRPTFIVMDHKSLIREFGR